jgi:hypothetical protein
MDDEFKLIYLKDKEKIKSLSNALINENSLN